MKLRTKTLAVVCMVCTIFFIIMTSLLHVIIMQSYSQLEIKITTDHVTRASNQFTHEYSSLLSISYDWSTWDDTYVFIENANEQYIQTNLDYVIFEDIQINFMIFYNESDSLLFYKAFDFYEKKEIILPASLFLFIDDNKDVLLHHQNNDHSLSGIIVYDQMQTPLLISVTPILKSNKEGPIRGTLLIGRFLDEEKLNYFSTITQLSVSVYPFSNLSFLFYQYPFLSSNEDEITIQPINGTHIAGYTVLDDVFGNPVLFLKVTLHREIYNQGLNVLQNLFIALFITTVFMIIVTILIIDKFVTSRLTSFSKSVGEVQSIDDLRKNIDVEGNDEISVLGKNINNMLMSLQNLWAMKDSAELSLQKKIEELEKFKTLTIDRELKMIELKRQIQEIKDNGRREDVG